VDGTGSRLCTMEGFSISGAEPLVSANKALVNMETIKSNQTQ
jgi:hypothetical protein